MGSCYSCSVIKNKVRPTTPKSAVPKTITDNFVRGRGDGESDASDTEKVAKSPLPPSLPLVYPGHLERHVLGSSFSSSYSSQSIPDIGNEDKKEVERELKGEGGGGGINNGGLMLRQHSEVDPLKHFYQLTGSSRLQHHESLSRYDMLSEVASEVKTEGGLTDVSIDLDHPFAPFYQDGTVVESMLSRPRSVGIRGRSSYARDMMSQLSNYSEFESPRDPSLKREDTPIPGNRNARSQGLLGGKKSTKKKGKRPKWRAGTQHEDIRRTIPSGLSDSSLSIVSDDGGSSLSSTSDLSAIGELSELCSSAESRRSIKPIVFQSNPPPKKQSAKKAMNREKSNLSIKTPKSAETVPVPKVINLSPVLIKSADLLNRRVSSSRLTKDPHEMSTSFTKPTPVSGAWGDRFHRNQNVMMAAKENRYSNHFSSSQSSNAPATMTQMSRNLYGRDSYSPTSPGDLLKLTSPSPRETERPMAARPRRPGTGQTYHPTPAPRPSVSKRLASLIKEDLYPEETMEPYPDLPGTLGEFQTIIII